MRNPAWWRQIAIYLILAVFGVALALLIGTALAFVLGMLLDGIPMQA